MSYTVYNADGTSILVPDGAIDLTFYDSTNKVGIQLVGRNSIDFGQPMAQNLLQMVENFAGPNTPGGNGATAPIGMLWYDDVNSLLKLQTASNVWSPVVTTDTNGILTTSTDIYVHGSTSTGVRVGFGNNSISTNTVVGNNALISNTTGTWNTAIGQNALATVTTNGANTAVGRYALKLATSANNVAIGASVLSSATTGGVNTSVGSLSGAGVTTGSGNTFLGYASGLSITTGSNNVILGSDIGTGITSGSGNVIVGNGVSGLSSSLANNIVIANGVGVIKAQHNGTDWTLTGTINGAVTDLAGGSAGVIPYQSASGSTLFTAVGTAGQVLTSNGTGTPYWAASGGGGGGTVTTVSVTTANGVSGTVATATTTPAITLTLGAITPTTVNRLHLNAPASIGNIAIGYSTLGSITTGISNTGVGYQSMIATTTGEKNTAVGLETLYSNDIGIANTALGYRAMRENISGEANTAVGYSALRLNTTGQRNASLGAESLYSNNGNENTSTGYQALLNNTGNNNTASGAFTLYELSTGANNTALGHSTGRGITTGSGNTIVGANVLGLAAGLTNNIILANGTGAIKAQHNGTDWDFKTNKITNVVNPVNPQDAATKNYVDNAVNVSVSTTTVSLTTGTTDFANGSLRCSRVANMITITATGGNVIFFTGSLSVVSSGAVIPALYRPNHKVKVCYQVLPPNLFATFLVDTDGTITLQFYDYLGTPMVYPDTSSTFTISYCV